MKLLLFALLTILSWQGFGQGIYNDKSLLSQDKKTTYLSKKTFNKKVREVFGQLVTGQGNAASVANSASSDIAEGKLTFNGSFGISDRFLSSVAATGKIDNSVAELFDNYKLNSDVSLDLRLHLRLFSRFRFDPKDSAELVDKRKYLQLKRTVLQDNIPALKTTRQNFVNMKAIHLMILRDSINKIRNLVNSQVLSGDAADREQRRHLSEQFYRMGLDSVQIRLQIDSVKLLLHDTESLSKLSKIYDDSINNEIEEAGLAAPLSSIKMLWLTARLSPSRQKFYLYDSLRPFNRQLTDTAFTAAYYGLELSYYYWTHKHFSFYGNIGGGFEQINNKDTLNTIAVEDSRSESSGNEARKTDNKYSAYTGLYQEVKAWKLYMNFYFFGAGNKWAFHLFPEWQFWKGTTIRNVGFGFVLSFKSSKDAKTIINAEPYFQLRNTGERISSKIVDRQRQNSIGLRIGLPIGTPDLK